MGEQGSLVCPRCKGSYLDVVALGQHRCAPQRLSDDTLEALVGYYIGLCGVDVVEQVVRVCAEVRSGERVPS